MPHSTRKLLLDVSLSCQEIIEFTNSKDYDDFRQDRMLQLAIEREFEIIGFRNIIAHGYDVIDLAAMWDFVKNRVPELLEKVQKYP